MNGAKDLVLLGRIINHVYIPMEKNKSEVKSLLQSYIETINHSINQVTGSRSIQIPQNIEPDDEVAIRNKDLIEQYEGYLQQWKEIIDITIENEKKKTPEPGSAIAVIDFWRARSTVLSTLYQELTKPEVAKITNRVAEYNQQTQNQIMTSTLEFTNSMKNLTKHNGIAKDNVKFLNTLERQFKNLQCND